MTRVNKEKNLVMNDVINVQTEEGSFYISFEKDLNLYFSYLGNTIDDKDEYSFSIDKENLFLYECFDELYDSIESEKPFKYSDNLLNPDYVYPLSKVSTEFIHEYETIDFHSEDEDYDLSSVLKIKKGKDSYVVSFKKSKAKVGHSAYSVCIKNGGSRYDPYNVSFMIMYNKLRAHDFDLDNVQSKGYNKVLKR